MTFDVYFPFYSQKYLKTCPGVNPNPMEYSKIKSEVFGSAKVKELIEKHRAGDTTAKIQLPAVCWTGRSVSTRKNSAMIPTQFFMIDIDHCIMDPVDAWLKIKETLTHEWVIDNILFVAVTPSFGLRIIAFAQEGYDTLEKQVAHLDEICRFWQYGELDKGVHDFARLSFACLADEILFENVRLILNTEVEIKKVLTNLSFEDEKKPSEEKEKSEKSSQSAPVVAKPVESRDWIPSYSDEEKEKLKEEKWKNFLITDIINAWVDFRGEPGDNEIHNYYNEMVKYFRNILGNNKRKIFYLLPRFGHTEEECWSQVKSICKSNTLSRLDKEFYWFLVDRGFMTSKKDESDREYMLSEGSEVDINKIPSLPPVIREFVAIAPADFKIPMINALLPILGTLSSYVGAVYPYDGRVHTTSFFSVIYGPPSSGKGFVDRTDFLFDDLRLRDMVQAAREQIYLKAISRKGANEKSPEQPHTSLRIIPPKNSEAEFLEKQKENQGYHMFTFAAEMDSWAKGEKAAGGNKSDMIRIAWDNGEYGQQFKSAFTFKGKVKLYWNVLITGTLNQVEKYFDNVENGLASRCSFCSIENQEYKLAEKWKNIPQKGMQVIRNYMKRCDMNTYTSPCNIDPSFMETVADEDFDKEVDWRFSFKPRQMVDIDWIIPIIDEFEEQEMKKAALALDPARDSFRRRVGVRGFRLALLCTTLYQQLSPARKVLIMNFVKWWMRVDLDNILNLLGARYNEQLKSVKTFHNPDVYAALSNEFDDNDVIVTLTKFGKKTRVRQVIYRWVKMGVVEKISKNRYKKILNNETKNNN